MSRGVWLIDVPDAQSIRTLASVVLAGGRSGLDLVGYRSRLRRPSMLIPVLNALWTVDIATDPSGVARIRPIDDDSTPGGVQQTTSLLRGPVALDAARMVLMMPDLDDVRIRVIGRIVLLQHRAHSVHATDRSAKRVLDGVGPF